jgi:hypothetical protein
MVFVNRSPNCVRSFRQPGIDEHQRGTMLLHQFHQPVVDLVLHFVGGDWSQGGARHFNREIKLALVPDSTITGAGRPLPVRK